MSRAPLALFAFVAISVACQRVDFLVVEPKSVAFERVGDTRAVSVIGKNRQGIEYPKIMVAWESKDPRVATVERGVVKAVGHGRTLVVVRTSNIQAEIPVEVVVADKIEVKPTEVVMALETGAIKLHVTVLDPDGREIRRTIHTRCAKAEVCSSTGDTVFPIDVGTTTVDVAVGEKTVALPVTVVEKASQIGALRKK